MLIKKLQFLQAKVITEFEAHWQMLRAFAAVELKSYNVILAPPI